MLQHIFAQNYLIIKAENKILQFFCGINFKAIKKIFLLYCGASVDIIHLRIFLIH